MTSGHLPPDLLSALVDGEVPGDERRAAYEHLQECASCSRTMDGYSAVRRMVTDLPRLPAPETLVSAALRHRTGPVATLRRGLTGPRRYVAAAVASAAVAITVAGVASPADEELPPVDVLVARHAGATATNSGTGQVIFAVTGR